MDEARIKTKKIAVIELETHASIINLWMKLLYQSTRIEVTFYLNYKLKPFLKITSNQNIIWYDNQKQNEKEFLSANFASKNYDLVVINTLHKRFNAYQSIIDSYKTILLIHNLNFYFLGLKALQINSFLKSSWKEKVFFTKIFFKEKVQTFLRKNKKRIIFCTLLNDFPVEFPIKKLPLIFNNSLSPIPDNLTISIPGEISQKRKDIHLVLEAIKKCHPKVPTSFIFLGKASDVKIISELKNVKKNSPSNIDITYFTENIPEKVFNKYIHDSSILLCPIHHKTSFNFIKEEYSKTKISGNEIDCFFNGKIGIFPKHYSFNHWANLYYSSKEDLISILNNLDIQRLKEYEHKLKEIVHKNSFSKVQKELENELINLSEQP